MNARARRLVTAAALFLALAAPLVATDFQLFRLTNVVIFAIALLGLNILVGYNGQISLGHGAFYALGAYACAIQVAHLSVPHWAAIPAAGAICMAAGMAFAWPVLRLGGVHLALVTFALGAVLPRLVGYKPLERWTGGHQGLALDRPDVPFGLPVSFDQWMYLLSLAALALLFAGARNLLGGRIGRALIAIRDHPEAAAASGIAVGAYKTAAFGVSAMCTGIAGALAALALQYVAPGLYGPFLSFGFLIGIAIGGLASLSGAIYGALFLQVIFFGVGATARAFSTTQVFLIYGAAVVVFVLLLPGGIASLVDRALRPRPQRDLRDGARVP